MNSCILRRSLQHAVGIIGWAWRKPRTIASLAFSTLFLVEAIETIKNNALIAANYDMMKKQTKNWKTTNLQTCDLQWMIPFVFLRSDSFKLLYASLTQLENLYGLWMVHRKIKRKISLPKISP